MVVIVLEDHAPVQQEGSSGHCRGEEDMTVRPDTDGHTGVEHQVLAKLAIRPRIEQVSVVLVRLREANWWRHYAVHIDSRPSMGRILGALLDAKTFAGCPVVGECRYAVMLSCGPSELGRREDALKEWFQNFVFAMDEALRQWVDTLESWEAGRAALLPAGLPVPPLAEVLQKFQPEPGQRIRLPNELWG